MGGARRQIWSSSIEIFRGITVFWLLGNVGLDGVVPWQRKSSLQPSASVQMQHVPTKSNTLKSPEKSEAETCDSSMEP